VSEPDEDATALLLGAAVPLVALPLAAVVPLVAAVLAAVPETAEPVVTGRVATAEPVAPLALVATAVDDVAGALVAVGFELPPHAARIAAAALAAIPPRNPRLERYVDRTPSSFIIAPLQCCAHRSVLIPVAAQSRKY
jgi:hypothetical protein